MTVGPDYHLPEQALANAPVAQGGFEAAKGIVSADPLPERWWHLFDDPVLDGLIDRALAGNTDLRVAQANLEQQHALLAEVRSAQEVDFGIDLQTSFAQASAAAVLKAMRPPEHLIYNAGLSVSYDLDLFGRLRRGVEAATDDDEAVQAAHDLVWINVVAETARAYADLCGAGEQIDDLHALLAVQEQATQVTRRLVEHGRAAPLEIERQQAALEALQSRAPMVEARQRNAAYRIASLMGQLPEQFDPALLACHQPLALTAIIPVGDGGALLKRRPDLRAAERRLAAAVARIGVATAGLYPDIRLGASIGSTGPAAIAFTPLANRFAIGPSVSWNLHQSPTRTRIEQAEAQSRASLAVFDGEVLLALREVESYLARYAAGLQRLDDLRAAHEHAASVARRTRTLRDGGRLSALAALDAEREFAQSRLVLGAAQSELNYTQIELFLALGGGWEAQRPQDAALPSGTTTTVQRSLVLLGGQQASTAATADE